jgi:hypothetical protein
MAGQGVSNVEGSAFVVISGAVWIFAWRDLEK